MGEYKVARDVLTVGHADDEGVVHTTDYKRGDSIVLDGERERSFLDGGLVSKSPVPAPPATPPATGKK